MSRKSEIIEEALLLYAEKGYEGMTLKEIAKRVGVTAPAVYAFFKNKEDLFVHMCKGFLGTHFQIAFDHTQQLNKQTAEEKLESIVRDIFVFQISKPMEIKVFLRLVLFPPDVVENDVMDEFHNLENKEMEIFEHVFRDAISNGEIRDGDPNVYAESFLLFMDGLFWQMQRLEENAFWERFDRQWRNFWLNLKDH